MRKIEVRLTNSYEVRIGSQIIHKLRYWLNEETFTNKVVIITNPLLKKLYGDSLESDLSQEGFKVTMLLAPDGEAHKSLDTACKLYYELSGCRAERTTPILALGGGVIGDLAGFVAATYLRGVPLIHIPTTLLAQVDSSIGGKVALNHSQVKNKIGAFYQPRLVVTDIKTLLTLTTQQLSDGLAEVIKYAMVQDKEFFTYLEENIKWIMLFEDNILEEVVYKSAKIKSRIIEKDERDFGLRHILNYGHTIGHAIETVSNYKVSHGQAVAIGMVAEGRISNKLNILSQSDLYALKQLIQRAGLPIKIPNLNIEEVIQVMKHDKKNSDGKIRFVLPKSIGEVFITSEVTPSLIEEVLGYSTD